MRDWLLSVIGWRRWPLIINACFLGAVVWCQVLRADLARKDAKLQRAADVMQLTVERINHARAAAEAADQANARRVETAYTKASQETARDLASALQAARAEAAAYARRLRLAEAARGGSGLPDMPKSAEPASRAATAGEPAELDADLALCAENTVRLESWSEWWRRVSAETR